jgi:hypothetical protein
MPRYVLGNVAICWSQASADFQLLSQSEAVLPRISSPYNLIRNETWSFCAARRIATCSAQCIQTERRGEFLKTWLLRTAQTSYHVKKYSCHV